MIQPLVYIISILITLLTWMSGYSLFASLCIPLFLLSLIFFISKIPHSIPFRELAIMVTILQLLVASFIAFYIEDPNPIFKPKGNADDYFTYAVPGVILFGLGLFTFQPKVLFDNHFLDRIKAINLFKIGKEFIVIGWVALLIQPFVPGSIGYFVTLVHFLTYIGGIMLLFAPVGSQNRVLWIVVAFLPVVQGALFSGIFFLAMVWIAYLILYYLYQHKGTFSFNMAIIIFGLYAILVTDSAKKDYRALLGDDNSSLGLLSKSIIFGKLFIDNASFQVLSSKSNISGRVTRANQGALVTWVMDHTPARQPFGEGETIKDAVVAAIFPRFLMPNKAQTGGKVLFEKYTGYQLNGTSMNLSLLGEGWANFGYWGGLLFMFSVGAFYSLAFKYFTQLVNKFPIYFFFIPFIFIYTIKAEDDLLTPLNHIIKASMVLFILHHYYIKKLIR